MASWVPPHRSSATSRARGSRSECPIAQHSHSHESKEHIFWYVSSSFTVPAKAIIYSPKPSERKRSSRNWVPQVHPQKHQSMPTTHRQSKSAWMRIWLLACLAFSFIRSGYLMGFALLVRLSSASCVFFSFLDLGVLWQRLIFPAPGALRRICLLLCFPLLVLIDSFSVHMMIFYSSSPKSSKGALSCWLASWLAVYMLSHPVWILWIHARREFFLFLLQSDNTFLPFDIYISDPVWSGLASSLPLTSYCKRNRTDKYKTGWKQ